jgi:hypothetical protein
VKLHRPPTRAARLGRALLLLLFAAGSPAVGGAYRCCTVEEAEGHHGSVTARAAVTAPDAADAHAHHQAPTTARTAASSDAEATFVGAPHGPSDPGARPCECVGQCQDTPLARPPIASIATVDVARTVVTVIRVGAARVMPVTDWEHRQPLASGPPTNAQA